ncbi:MAG: LysR family transcriptional regulator [Burkholderiales bacterium]|nr:LysR family transcriptional regulator [Burkholderiales bacterium]MCW5604014.1 LysR family transcriptional regulator [Burkholderiales bacterium]
MKVKNRALLGQLGDVDLRLLRVFKTVADCGSMAAAELELNIGISTISRHVKDLEIRLGLTLCRRGRSGFSLTAEGARVYESTLRLLASTDAFRASVDEIHRRMGGQLNIAVHDKTSSNPAARIGEAIALFCEHAPGVALNLHVAHINAIERGIIDGQFQVGIIPGHRRSDSFAYDALFGETMLLYCGASHPLFKAADKGMNWNGLAAFQFAGLGYHSPNMELSQKKHLRRNATAFDQEGIANLILSGKFLGFLPDHYAASFVALNRMRAIRPALFRYQCVFHCILRRSPEPSRATRAFQACLIETHRSASDPS